MYLIADYQ